jgi:hypothetical protein
MNSIGRMREREGPGENEGWDGRTAVEPGWWRMMGRGAFFRVDQ